MSSVSEIGKETIRINEIAHVKIIDTGLGAGLEIRFRGNPEPIHILTNDADIEYHMIVKKMRNLAS